MNKIGLKISKKNNLFDAITYFLEKERLDYDLIDDSYDYETIIVIGDYKDSNKLKGNLILINNKIPEKDYNGTINYIITDFSFW